MFVVLAEQRMCRIVIEALNKTQRTVPHVPEGNSREIYDAAGNRQRADRNSREANHSGHGLLSVHPSPRDM